MFSDRVCFFLFFHANSIQPPIQSNPTISDCVCVCVILCHRVLMTMHFNCVYVNYIRIQSRTRTTMVVMYCSELTRRAQLGQGIRIGGGSVMPITGPGGLQQHANTQQHHHTADRRSNGNLRVSICNGFTNNEQYDLNGNPNLDICSLLRGVDHR